jgi:hypothetical protein
MNVKVPMFYAVNYMLALRHGHYCEYDCVYKHKFLRGLLFKVWFLTILTSGYLTMVKAGNCIHVAVDLRI